MTTVMSLNYENYNIEILEEDGWFYWSVDGEAGNLGKEANANGPDNNKEKALSRAKSHIGNMLRKGF